MSADRSSPGFGGTLREARERRGISLRQIADATKISIAALDALERNDISRLPGGIFSRAFVRSYAVEVGLDPEKTIQAFIAEFPHDAVTAGHPTSDGGEDREAIESERRTAGTFAWLGLISVPLAALLVYFASSGYPGARPSSATRSASPAVAPSAATTEATPPRSSDGSASGSAGSTRETRPEPPPVDSPSPPKASATATAGAAPTPIAPAPSAGGSTDAAEVAAAPADRLTIELAVRRPCWISATVDGQKAIERLLQPGDRQTIDVRREMVLTAGDASAVMLTLNGREGRALGRQGEVITARVNPTNFRNYLPKQ